MPSIKPDYIIQLSGQPCATYRGVLDLAHEMGLESIHTELLQVPGPDNDHVAIVRAEVRMKSGGHFSGIGDASPKNVNARIATASIRMAETRAKGRALRDAVNIGEALVEEMPDGEPDAAPTARPAAAPKAQTPAAAQPPKQQAPPASNGQWTCVEPGCGKALTQGQHEHSIKEFGRSLCPTCQRKAKQAAPPDPPAAAPQGKPEGCKCLSKTHSPNNPSCPLNGSGGGTGQ